MSFIIGLLTGTSCTLMGWGVHQWFSRRRRERLTVHESQAARVVTIIEENSMTCAGLSSVVAQWLITGFVAMLFSLGPNPNWRSGDVALAFGWLASVVMLGLLGASYGVRRKKTIYRSDAKT
jgi:type IV secretory pathway TrbD component